MQAIERYVSMGPFLLVSGSDVKSLDEILFLM